ncbi:unnamed protein product [Discosporangium mesarthrocarpum]
MGEDGADTGDGEKETVGSDRTGDAPAVKSQVKNEPSTSPIPTDGVRSQEHPRVRGREDGGDANTTRGNSEDGGGVVDDLADVENPSGIVGNAPVVRESAESRGASGGDSSGVNRAKEVEDEGDESSDDDGDGFTVVVAREAPPPSSVGPVKRFLQGTNILVNMPTSSGGTKGGDARGGDTRGNGGVASKPMSAAAGIASLTPSSGAPTPAARPSLQPGEYPPTAELQRATGKTAFDIDIDGMEEQPWRHPGVDIADFFNYGFTEDSWRVYCEKQLRCMALSLANLMSRKQGGIYGW